MIRDQRLAVFSALSGGCAVLLGAFAAHGVDPEAKALLATGSHYQIVHALLALACAGPLGGGRATTVAGWLAASGGLVFSGALAGIALADLRILGAVAPAGGVMMVAGWLILAVALLKSPSVNA
ncbi:MAG: DUF423 domain-containing protein [Brevundimonas sp.]|uniref:DUF423 domain-containing protein n=1 Tax=Brevundimonas sp. TaxID=1871086 RepID=UPI0025C36F60|nr:DUF423 domain-containing protein [Brevundimonas sp.]MBX3478045.1 DUF423 domain-containing protein [Brevundimonas sp.]